MDITSTLLTRVREQQKSVNLLHLVVQNWIVFQRSTFDYFDDQGDPYISQIFLIQVHTGRFIHRAQGVKIEDGITLDINVLVRKLWDAFEGTTLCHGWDVENTPKNDKQSQFKVLEYPFPRYASKNCKHLIYKPFKTETTGRSICPSCEELGNGLGPGINETFDDSNGDFDEDLVKDEAPESLDDVSYDILKHLEDSQEEDLKIFSESDLDEPGSINYCTCNEESFQPCEFCSQPEKSKPKPENSNLNDSDSDVLTDEKKKNGKKPKSATEGKIYMCNHCSKVFPTKSFYARHQREKRIIGCRHCSKKIVTFSELKQHLVKFHSMSLPEHLNSLWQNDEDETIMQYPKICFTCDRLYNGNIMLSRHKEIYHELGDHKCSDCSEPCLTFYDLVIHSYRAHSKAIPHIKPYTQGLFSETNANGKVEIKRQHFACHFCPKTFKFDSEYTKHMRKFHAWGQFECRSCDEIGHYSKDITAHARYFHPQNPEVKCPNCSLVVNLKTDEQAFISHYWDCKFKGIRKAKVEASDTSSEMSLVPRKAEFQCHYCGKEYYSKNSLKTHVQQHEGVERFKCTYCDYGTNIKAVLIDHEKHHLRERGLTNEDTGMQLYYNCDQCDKKYSQQSGLYCHRKRVHQGIKRNYPCKDCGAIFSNLQGYYRHKRQRHGFVSKQVGRRGRKPLN